MRFLPMCTFSCHQMNLSAGQFCPPIWSHKCFNAASKYAKPLPPAGSIRFGPEQNNVLRILIVPASDIHIICSVPERTEPAFVGQNFRSFRRAHSHGTMTMGHNQKTKNGNQNMHTNRPHVQSFSKQLGADQKP